MARIAAFPALRRSEAVAPSPSSCSPVRVYNPMCIVPEVLVTRFPSIPVRYSCCVLRRLNYVNSFWGLGALPVRGSAPSPSASVVVVASWSLQQLASFLVKVYCNNLLVRHNFRSDVGTREAAICCHILVVPAHGAYTRARLFSVLLWNAPWAFTRSILPCARRSTSWSVVLTQHHSSHEHHSVERSD